MLMTKINNTLLKISFLFFIKMVSFVSLSRCISENVTFILKPLFFKLKKMYLKKNTYFTSFVATALLLQCNLPITGIRRVL